MGLIEEYSEDATLPQGVATSRIGGDSVPYEQSEPVESSLLNLTGDQQELLGLELQEQLTKAYDAGSGYRDDVRDWRAQYEGDLDEKPEKWQANYNLPHISAVIDTIADRLANLICSGVPFFSCEAENPAHDQDANLMEHLMEYFLRRSHFAASVRLGILDTLISGTNWIVSWQEPNPNRRDIGENENATPETLETLPLAPPWMSPEDCILMPFEAATFRQAKGAFVRTSKRWNDLRLGLEDSKYYKEGVEKVKANWGTPREQTYQQEAQGIEVTEPRDLWTAQFETWWGIYRWVKPGDKGEADYIVDVAWSPNNRSAVVLRVAPYDNKRFVGWPFSVIANRPRKDTMWGRSPVKQISGIQKFFNATFDQMTDALTVSIMPPLAIRPGSRRRRLVWGPQQEIQVSNPATDIVAMAPSGSTLGAIGAAINMHQLAQNMSDRATGTTEPTMGVESQARRTATEMGIMEAGGSVRFDAQVAYLEIGAGEDHGLESFAQKTAGVLSAFMPRVPFTFPSAFGKRKQLTAPPSIYDGRFRFTLHANSSTANPELRLKKALASVAQIQQCPLTLPSPLDSEERLIEKMRAIWRAYREIWQAMGHKDPEEVIGAEPQTTEEALAVAAAIPGANPIAQTLAARFGLIPPPTGVIPEQGGSALGGLPTGFPGEGNPARRSASPGAAFGPAGTPGM